MRDYVFEVSGQGVQAGYHYPLLGAIKGVHPLLGMDNDVFFGPIENVAYDGAGWLGFRGGTRWRCRAKRSAEYLVLDLCGARLRIGEHAVRLGRVETLDLVPSSSLYAELVTIRSHHFQKMRTAPTHQEFLGWCADKLRCVYDLSDQQIEIGRRRQIRIGEHPVITGYAIGLYGLSDDQSLAIQTGGLGGRRHMGASMFLPGEIPQHVRNDTTRFSITAHKRPDKQGPPLDWSDYKLGLAGSFMGAVRAGRYPDSRWLAAEAKISRTRAERLIRALRRDFKTPLVHDSEKKGWYLQCSI